jgi:DNA-directed RNA polymerase specialized sigma24 family protein
LNEQRDHERAGDRRAAPSHPRGPRHRAPHGPPPRAPRRRRRHRQEATIAITRYRRPLRIPPGHTAEDARRFVLCKITRRRAARHHAERARTPSGDPVSTRERDEHARHLERWHGAAPSIEQRILERGRLTLLYAAVDKLRTYAPHLHAVIQGELEGVPIARLAVELRISLGTAYARAWRGRKALRAQLRRWACEETRGEACMLRSAARREQERWS